MTSRLLHSGRWVKATSWWWLGDSRSKRCSEPQLGWILSSWTLSGDDVHVQTSYNTVNTAQNAAVGGTGGDFVEMGGGTGNVAMGNAGNDAYMVDASDNGVVNELGIRWAEAYLMLTRCSSS